MLLFLMAESLSTVNDMIYIFIKNDRLVFMMDGERARPSY